MRKSIMVRALLLLVFAPGVAGSQTIYKCAVKGKPTSYQTDPCAANAKFEAIREYSYAPVIQQPPVAPKPRQPSKNRQRARPRSAQLHSVYNGTGSQSACENAKRDRDAWERRVGLSRSYDSLQIWNDKVQRACK